MSTTMTLVDGATTIPLTVGGKPNPNAVIVKDYDLGFPDVREAKADLAGQSGTLDVTTYHGGRVVKLDVAIVDTAGATRHQTMDRLRAACHPSHRPLLYVQCDGWMSQRVLTLRGQPASCVVGPTHSEYLEATLAWVAPSGVMLAATPTTVSLYPTLASTTGVYFPLTFPLSWVPGSAISIQNITNNGTEVASPVWIVYGAVTNPALTNRTTGATLVLDAIIPAGHFAIVDVGARTALMDGDPSQSLYGTIDFTVSSWWTVPPGANAIQVTASTNDVNAQAFFTWSDTWI